MSLASAPNVASHRVWLIGVIRCVCRSRDKKREYLEGLEAAVATLKAENKDLKKRMIDQNTHSIMNGGQYILPLSPDPSSIAIPAKQEQDHTPRHFSPMSGDDSADEDEEDDQDSMRFDRERSMSTAPVRRLSVQTNPEPAAQTSSASSQYAQALVALTTENASLKTRLGKLEQVIQVLLGMNGGVAPVATTTNPGLDILRLLGPDQPEAPVANDNFGTLDPSTYLPPQVSPSDISPGLPCSQTSSASQTLPSDILPTGPALTFPATSTSLTTFPTTENKDHARHPAAMTTNPELTHVSARGSALQRACFSSPAPSAREARERESSEMKNKVVRGLKRVLEWRTRCLSEQPSREDFTLESSMRNATMISSAA